MREDIIEYRINRYLTLKLEGGKTFIYVDGQKFRQCMRLVLTIPLDEAGQEGDLESIDEASFKYGTVYEGRGQEGKLKSIDIPPEDEFWGHCSNIEAWYECGYDTRIIHSNLAFPLLKALMDAGDEAARNAFNAELVPRACSGNFCTFEAIFYVGFFTHLTPEQRIQALNNLSIPRRYWTVANQLRQELRRRGYMDELKIIETILKKEVIDDPWFISSAGQTFFYFFTPDEFRAILPTLDWDEMIRRFKTLENFFSFMKLVDHYSSLLDASKELPSLIVRRFKGGIKHALESREGEICAQIIKFKLITHASSELVTDILPESASLGNTLEILKSLYDGLEVPWNAILAAIFKHATEFTKIMSQEYNPIIEGLVEDGLIELMDGKEFSRVISRCNLFSLEVERDALKQVAIDVDGIFEFKVNDGLNNGRVVFLRFNGMNHEVDHPNAICSPHPIREIPPAIFTLSKLETLIVTDHDVEHVSDSIRELGNLTTIDFSGNPLASLPNIFNELGKLQYLKVNGTLMKELPPSTCTLTNLIELNISSTEITSLPDCITNLVNLKSCILDHDTKLSPEQAAWMRDKIKE
ncbi:MAG: leucine-rich repeat domain-containing protein [Promethearchaeota archaeon]